jgi:oligosaccharide repeat unit polymerase
MAFYSSRNIFSPIFIFSIFIIPAVLASQYEIKMLMTIGVVFLSLGSLMHEKVYKGHMMRVLTNFRASKTQLGFKEVGSFRLTFKILIAVVFLGSAFYFYKVGVSLFADEVGLSRLVQRHAVPGSYLFQRLFRVLGPILCIIYFLSQDVEELKKYYKQRYMVALFLLISAFLVFTGLRGNLITFMFTPFLVVLGLKDGKPKLKTIVSIFLFALFGGIVLTDLIYGGIPLLAILILIIERLSGAATDGIHQMYNTDVPQNGFYGFQLFFNDLTSIFSKLGLTSVDQMNYSAYLAEQMLGSRYNGEAAAVYFMGEFYAAFGYPGVVIGSIIYGFFFQFVYVRLIKGPKTILRLSFYSYTLAVFVTILGGPTVSMFFDYIITISIFFLCYAVAPSVYRMVLKQ